MRRTPTGTRYSISDLTEFMESPFASWMSRLEFEHPERIERLSEPDTEGMKSVDKVLQDRGEEHELEVLEQMRSDGRDIAEISAGRGVGAGVEPTLAAMREGHEIIYQGQLLSPPFAGIADFLARVDGASSLGDYHYEVWDAKLARRAKPYFLVQLCAYAEMLEAIQGCRPEQVRVVLGTGETKSFRCDDFFYYYQTLKRAFLNFMQTFDPERPPIPEHYATHHRWDEHAKKFLEDRDHVSRVAHISRAQVHRLAETGIETLSGLAETEIKSVLRIQANAFDRLKEQATLQRDSLGLEQPLYRVVPADPNDPYKGLAQLPPSSPLDVYFDIEGYPLIEGGLEYLWGIVTEENGEQLYEKWWAHDAPEEKHAFEGFVDYVYERWRRDPSMHIYHYAAYEITALRKLMGRNGSREDEVDTLLRNHVFVDLYEVVRHGLRVGEPRYSIKNLEHLYMETRSAEVGNGADSIVFYEAFRVSESSAERAEILREIRDYNEEDCVSTLLLTRWLQERQRESAIAYVPPGSGASKGDTDELDDERPPGPGRELAERLLTEIPEDEAERARDPDRWHIQELLGQLVEFHQREMRPVWWSMHHRCDLSEEERIADLDCLAALERTEKPPFPVKKSTGFEYRFDPDQDTKLRAGDRGRVAQDRDVELEFSEVDHDAGRAVVKVGPTQLQRLEGNEPPSRFCMVHHQYINPGAIEVSLHDTARVWLDEGELAPALRDFLLRRPPRIQNQQAGALVGSDETAAEAVTRLVGNLDESTLCIQGPPGAGKTSSAAEAILALLAEGKRVAISSNSHSAILNLMEACANRDDGQLLCMKVGGDPNATLYSICDGAQRVASAKKAAEKLDTHRLVGGTAWAFSHPDLEGAFDTLFVDEAGQVSLANLIGMSRCARNLVLVGDQMQLGQPIQGSHPGESGLSTLDYLLRDHATVPPDRGVFLDRTWRLHPDICRFISGAVYEDRLQPGPNTANRVVRVPEVAAQRITRESGLVFVPVEHVGNTQASDEEVDVICAIVDELVGREVTDEQGQPAGQLTLDDILFVAPYNMQVRRLREALGEDAAVGSVDLFQGREARVVIVSMCASDLDGAARGSEFLLDTNRLNVALSRAQSLAIVVGNPALGQSTCRSVEQLALVNLFCRLQQEGSTSP
jgi:predicted RecB family nuclease